MQGNKDQLERFKEAAREHSADETDDALDKAFGKLKLKRKPEEKSDKLDK